MIESQIKSLAFDTYIDSCNGMCNRVLKDIRGLSYDNKDLLLEAYITDKNQGGRDYSAIIELGQLVKELEERTINKQGGRSRVLEEIVKKQEDKIVTKRDKIMTLGKNIRALRIDKGMSLSDVQFLTGLSKSTISETEREVTTPTIYTVNLIAKALNISIDELMKG